MDHKIGKIDFWPLVSLHLNILLNNTAKKLIVNVQLEEKAIENIKKISQFSGQRHFEKYLERY